jgi:hypothetical protein
MAGLLEDIQFLGGSIRTEYGVNPRAWTYGSPGNIVGATSIVVQGVYFEGDVFLIGGIEKSPNIRNRFINNTIAPATLSANANLSQIPAGSHYGQLELSCYPNLQSVPLINGVRLDTPQQSAENNTIANNTFINSIIRVLGYGEPGSEKLTKKTMIHHNTMVMTDSTVTRPAIRSENNQFTIADNNIIDGFDKAFEVVGGRDNFYKNNTLINVPVEKTESNTTNNTFSNTLI